MVCNTGRGGSVRLTGYDTPETFRPGCTAELHLGRSATVYLEQRLRTAQMIAVEMEGKDRYDRLLVRMRLDGRDLAQIMISQGLAVPYDGGRRINWCDRLRQS
ncbi:thermonuclease family protein [Aestuariivita sp.]|jgi:endonuclease YncB( thermonuclease family)|uniref:thermonuclease family protein n=1 Tax=Aestuariivita sp. TaxID=1872407 RepID=UPI0021702EDC|nr:thermonuclease family protein [Aestuariivita sp.]MCE8008899.1 thermonuclease family protein [Aestuariivita sp.]